MPDKPNTAGLAYTFGDIVYLRVRSAPVKGMVTSVHIVPTAVTYGVTWGDDGHESCHYSIELTTEYVPDYS